jgi:nitrite reductase/ring-hydroxylating ferredoxin subunit
MGWRAHRYAPAPGTLLCPVNGVDDGACKELRFGDGDGMLSLLLYRRSVEIHAYVNSCPHFSLPLNSRPDSFLLMAGARVMCVWHCAVFGLEDGRCLEGPAQGMALEAVPITVRDGGIFVAEP